MENKKRNVALFGIGGLIVLFLVIGVSYAVWQLVLQQTNENVVTTGCFKINFTEKNDIQLNNAYPIIDSEGKKLTPYEFTLENTCDSSASYQVNLEILDTTTLKSHEYIKVMFDEKMPMILTNYENAVKTLDIAVTSYQLGVGYLEAKETKTFTLRLWMDEDTPPTDEVMNKIFKSKIVITSSYIENPNKNKMMAMDLNYSDQCECITGNNTYTQNRKYKVRNLIFESSMVPHSTTEAVVDFSEAQDKSVLGYYVLNEDNSTHDLYIQADGKIKVNEDASYYFESVMYVEGLENLDTSFVTDMSYMFRLVKNETLDLSSFDTTNVNNMVGIFNGCSSLTSLNLSSFDTLNVTNMSETFSYCSNLTFLDLSSLDTMNVISMNSMFLDCSNLTQIIFSESFVYKSGAITTNMFQNCPANKPTHESWNGVTF